MGTKIADVVIPEVFNPYVVERTAELSALQASGIIANNPELDALAQRGGRLVQMPYWQDLTGDDEVLDDDSSLAPGKIEADKDVAVLLMRGRAWRANDLAGALAGDDPMAAIGDLVAEYWARRRQATLLSILDGVFDAASMSDNVHDIKAESDADKRTANGKTILDATQRLGDAKSRLVGLAMHSATENHLAKNDLIDYLQDSQGQPTIPTFMGKRVIVDDGLPILSGEGYDDNDAYVTYLFGDGAFGLGNGMAPVPTETDRDSLAGNDILINRQHFLLHPRGVAFVGTFGMGGTISGSSPTNTELENGDNWDRAYESKNIRIVRFEHTLA